ncbi:MAG: succinate dehydrogenase/fumarate reductase iron-sulfur subunit [Bacteroidales bacterium]|nr:succinate dehydrogenase/fumarate reductase iron-sulfur subunit [Bacteroidales bacterium]
MDLTLKIWRQENAKAKGRFVTYQVSDISPDCSFLEMLDILNESLVDKFEMPIGFEHDCREGICGTCSLYINGRPHGPDKGITVCQMHMRRFKDRSTIVIEPFRARAFPVLRDLMIDRSAFDAIIQAGGYVSIATGNAPDAHAMPVEKYKSDLAMDAASCIGCGACVAACKNASAMLFVSAKISQLALLPQGKVEANKRAQAMVAKMDKLGFGNCTNTYACEAECPKEIKVTNIARMNREFFSAKVCGEKEVVRSGGAG